MMERMAGNFELFIAHELPQIGSYQPNLDTLRSTSTRIVSAAGEDSGEQGARRAAIALADQLGIPLTYLPGGPRRLGRRPTTLRRDAAPRSSRRPLVSGPSAEPQEGTLKDGVFLGVGS